jgi:hypothetical protein
MREPRSGPRGVVSRGVIAGSLSLLLSSFALATGGSPAMARPGTPVAPRSIGGLDCNGFSPIQRNPKISGLCTDPKGYDGGRFYDNGHYVGHDEPIIRFMSSQPGSGSSIVWNETLPTEPAANPTVHTPGGDVTHTFELTIAPWFGMALCNGRSYPLNPCTPRSDSNAPTRRFPGGGSSFLEMQFYPPGYAPFADNISCDNTHWCASLHINDLECTNGFVSCNFKCIEPTNFAFVQTDGVPTGPPSPQLSNLATFTPNGHTLLMNPGDSIRASIFDASIGNGKHALETRIDDLTTGKSGFMIASAKNGFMSTSFRDCSGHPLNYEPEYDTAGFNNVVPWAALQMGIATQFEIGHFTPCTRVGGQQTLRFGGFTDTFWKRCFGPYEKARSNEGIEPNDSPCFTAGDTHGGAADPNLVTGCVNFLASNGDIDFDGTPYWADWPDSTSPDLWPSTFREEQPTTNGHLYSKIQFQTDAAASESTCSPGGLNGCRVPPPGAPGTFYPYWTQAMVDGTCVWEFGQMTNGNTFGKDKQYGVASSWFFGNLEGPVMQLPNC